MSFQGLNRALGLSLDRSGPERDLVSNETLEWSILKQQKGLSFEFLDV